MRRRALSSNAHGHSQPSGTTLRCLSSSRVLGMAAHHQGRANHRLHHLSGRYLLLVAQNELTLAAPIQLAKAGMPLLPRSFNETVPLFFACHNQPAPTVLLGPYDLYFFGTYQKTGVGWLSWEAKRSCTFELSVKAVRATLLHFVKLPLDT